MCPPDWPLDLSLYCFLLRLSHPEYSQFTWISLPRPPNSARLSKGGIRSRRPARVVKAAAHHAPAVVSALTRIQRDGLRFRRSACVLQACLLRSRPACGREERFSVPPGRGQAADRALSEGEVGLKTGSHSHSLLRLAGFFLASLVAVLASGICLSHPCSLSAALLFELPSSGLSPGSNDSGEVVKEESGKTCIGCMFFALILAVQIPVFVVALPLLAGVGILHLSEEAFICNYISSARWPRAPPFSIFPA